MTEPYEPLPPRHGVSEDWAGEPKPVCPVCGASVRRNLDEDTPAWRCDLDGEIRPVWITVSGDE